ncbi:Hint domain-containing protein [Rhodobacter sp. 140A]|nr:Hint domain-containing protein [Rhodobacter sp. 140A]
MPDPVEFPLGVSAYLAGNTPVQTETGLCPLDRLEPGQRVITYCRGVQAIRAVSVLPASRVQALRPLALVFPGQEELRLTAGSRLLTATPWSELLFGMTEAMVPAGSLLSDPAVNRIPAENRPYYALHLDRPDFIYAGVALWLAFPAPVAGDGVVPFPHRLPRPELDHVETRLAHHYAGSVEHLLKTTLPRPPRRPGSSHATGAQASCTLRRSGATAATPISEVPRPSNDT